MCAFIFTWYHMSENIDLLLRSFLNEGTRWSKKRIAFVSIRLGFNAIYLDSIHQLAAKTNHSIFTNFSFVSWKMDIMPPTSLVVKSSRKPTICLSISLLDKNETMLDAQRRGGKI